MQFLELPSEMILPRILIVRLYDTVVMHHTVKKRISDTYELSFYLEGTGTLEIQGTILPIAPGVIRFIKPGMELSSTLDYRCITVFFDFGTADTVIQNPILENIPFYLATDGTLQADFQQLLKSYSSPLPTAPLAQNALLLSLLAKIYNIAHSHRKYSSAVRTCIEYMQLHFGENITLETLGDLTGYSRLHLLRLFKLDLGQTPHQFLTAIRLEQAKKLLSETDLSLEQIATICGFHSAPHFKSLFKAQTHFTPGIYRKNTRQI